LDKGNTGAAGEEIEKPIACGTIGGTEKYDMDNINLVSADDVNEATPPMPCIS